MYENTLLISILVYNFIDFKDLVNINKRKREAYMEGLADSAQNGKSRKKQGADGPKLRRVRNSCSFANF